MELARKSTSSAFGGSFLSHLLTNRLYRAVGVSAFGLVALYFYNRFSRNQGDERSHTRNPQGPNVQILNPPQPQRQSNSDGSGRAALAPPAAARRAPSNNYTLKHCMQSSRRIANFRLCISTQNLLFSADGSLIADAVPVIQHLAGTSDLYLIHQCNSNEEEARVLQMLEQTGCFAAGLNKNKMLFCQTAIGRAHMARQLEVHVHVDDTPEVLTTLAPHVGELVYVGVSNNAAAVVSRVAVLPSIAALANS